LWVASIGGAATVVSLLLATWVGHTTGLVITGLVLAAASAATAASWYPMRLAVRRLGRRPAPQPHLNPPYEAPRPAHEGPWQAGPV
jgi:hypothetical protein